MKNKTILFDDPFVSAYISLKTGTQPEFVFTKATKRVCFSFPNKAEINQAFLDFMSGTGDFKLYADTVRQHRVEALKLKSRHS